MKLFDVPLYKSAVGRVAAKLPVSGGTVLITGATGLIGSCLADVFLYANRENGCSFRVAVLGRNREALQRRFGRSDDVVILAQNVADPIETEGIEFDYLIHAASPADPRSYALYPAETALTNVLGAKNVLEYCREHPSARVMLTSTFEVYGKLPQDEYRETDFGLIDQNQLRSCYPESKRTAELLFRAYHDEYGTSALIARLASIYGPTMKEDDSKAHAQFLHNALNGENIVLKSKGEQKRTYCYVMDAVSALLTVLFRGEAGEAYNVANPDSIATIAEVAETVAGLAGTKVVFDLPDETERRGFGRPQNCILNTEKLESLGWVGEYTLRRGMDETLSVLKAIGKG